MKTTKKQTTELNLDSLTEGQLKALALMQFNGESFTIKDDEIFDANDDIVEPIEGDEERDNHIVLTDEEAQEKAKEYILDSAWAFNSSFLAELTGIDESVFKAIQANNKCESNNEAILRLINDDEEFVDEAINADGRGHFMNSYDGHENEATVNGQRFYIYRMN